MEAQTEGESQRLLNEFVTYREVRGEGWVDERGRRGLSCCACHRKGVGEVGG